jgi:tetratricopeptide (TPR) repeat protein
MKSKLVPEKEKLKKLTDKLYQLSLSKKFSEGFALAESVSDNDELGAEFWNTAALCAIELEELDKAEQYFDRSLTINPDFSIALVNYGNLLSLRKRFDEAEDSFRKAIEHIDNNYSLNSRYEAYLQHGSLLIGQGCHQEGIDRYQQAIKVNPNKSTAYIHMANLCLSVVQLDEAESWLRKALSVDAEDPNAKWSLSVVLLAKGEWEEGWRLFESRYAPGFSYMTIFLPTHLPFPQWKGQSLQGKSILLFQEQGYGDQIQFVRYGDALKKAGAEKVSVMCQTPLKKLFQSLEWVDDVVSAEEHALLKPHDFWTLMMSIPHFIRPEIGDKIPADIPYLFTNPQDRKKWKKLLPKSGCCIGLRWCGAKEHANNHNRSLSSLTLLAPLWGISGVSFISLQKGDGEYEADHPPLNQPILPLGKLSQDFADTAALMDQLDLIISVDTSIVHLAGALGKTCWLILPESGPDWRWLSDADNSPWYPDRIRFFYTKKDEPDAIGLLLATALNEWISLEGKAKKSNKNLLDEFRKMISLS